MRNRGQRYRTGKGWYFGIGLVLLLALTGCQKREDTGNQGTPAPTRAASVTATLTPALSPGGISTPAPTEPAEPDGEPQTEARLAELLAGMSLEEKVGQMFLARCPEDAIGGITGYAVGGYVLFKRDFEGETKESVTES